jgi:hypothetical protein
MGSSREERDERRSERAAEAAQTRHLRTFSNDSPLTLRPAIDDRTFCANSSRFVRSSLAASDERQRSRSRSGDARDEYDGRQAISDTHPC